MNFSQRNGYIKPREAIQKDELDETTRTRIWNYFYEELKGFCSSDSFQKNYKKSFLKRRIDEKWNFFLDYEEQILAEPLNITFDFLEFVLENYDLNSEEIIEAKNKQKLELEKIKNLSSQQSSFGIGNQSLAITNQLSKIEKELNFLQEDLGNKIIELNQILEEEKVAYRFVNGIFIETESEAQIKQIEDLSNELKTANLSRSENHFNKAFRKLYDRNDPDYKTSIIESIQFLECLIGFKLNKTKSQFGDLKDFYKHFNDNDFELEFLKMFYQIYKKLCNNGTRHGASEHKKEIELLIDPNFNQAKLIFNLANSLASFLLTLDLTKK